MSGRATGSAIGGLLGALTIFIPVVGSFVAPFATAIGAYTGGMVGEAISPTPLIRNEQATIAGLNVQVSALGTPLPQYFGEGAGAGNVLYLDNRRIENIEDYYKGGVNVTKEYYCDLVIGIADTRITGPIQGIRKIFADGTLIYSRTDDKALPEGWTFFPGNAVGDPSTVIEATKGVGNSPGYPYLARVDIANYAMGTFPRVANHTFLLKSGAAVVASIYQMSYRSSDGSIWAAAPGTNEVLVYDSTTQMQTYNIDVDILQVGDDDNLSKPKPTAVGFPMGWENGSDALWIAHPSDYSLKRIDATTKEVTHVWGGTLSYVSGGFYLDSDMWFAAHHYNNSTGHVVRADGAGITVIATGQAKSGRIQIAATTTHIWVTENRYPDGGGQSQVHRIEPSSNTITASVNLGTAASSKPCDIVVTSADSNVWVLDQAAATVKRINTTPALAATIALSGGALPLQLCVASDGYVWVASSANGGTVYRINPATNTAAVYESMHIELTNQAQRVMVAGAAGTMWVLSRRNSAVMHFATDGTFGVIPTGGTPRGIVAESTTHVWTGTTRGEVRRIAEADNTIVWTQSAQIPRLKGTLTTLAEAAGIPAASVNFDDIKTNPMIGLKLNAVQSIRSAMEILLEGHQLFGFESNKGIKFRSRQPSAVVATIPEDELDAREKPRDAETASSPNAGLIVGKVPDEDLPTRIELTYISRARDYQDDVATAYVSNSRSATDKLLHVRTALTLSAAQAQQLAQEMLDQLWLTSIQYQQRLRRIYMHLEPGDLVEITSRDITHRMIMTEIGYDRMGIISFRARGDVTDNVNAFEGFVGQSTTVSRLPVESHTTARLLNLPAMNSADQVPRYHVGYEYPGSAWPGASLLRSVDSGVSYGLVDTATQALATTGTVATALASGSAYVIDTTSSFTVVLAVGSQALASISDAMLLSGGNLSQLGTEVLQFGVATLIGTRTYTCSRLLRGLRGTETAIATHGSNERFTLLDVAVRTIGMTGNDRNVERSFKAVTSGLDAGTVTPQLFTPTSANLKPWTVGSPLAYRQSNNDWILYWFARSRFVGAWIDNEPFGYDPDAQRFRVQLFSASDFATVRRTISVAHGAEAESVQTTTYTSAQQTTDSGGPLATIYVRIAQIGAYGAGQMTNLTFTG